MTREGLLQGIEASTEAALAEVRLRDRLLARDRRLVVDGVTALTEPCPGCEGSGRVEVGGGINGLGPDRREVMCGVCAGRKVVAIRCCDCFVRPAVTRDQDGDPLCSECRERPSAG